MNEPAAPSDSTFTPLNTPHIDDGLRYIDSVDLAGVITQLNESLLDSGGVVSNHVGVPFQYAKSFYLSCC
jgi:hypothetical protein